MLTGSLHPAGPACSGREPGLLSNRWFCGRVIRSQPHLLGKFSATSLTNYKGATGGVSRWTAGQQIATSDGTSAGTPLITPTALSNHGHVFEVIDDQS
jgi:hypothetical protein